jgi:sugar lactone lactonase YvrE
MSRRNLGIKKILSIILTALIVASFIPKSSVAFGDDTSQINQIGVIGVMPDEYIGAFSLNTANTYEDDFKSDLSYPMQAMTIMPDGNIAVCDTSYGRIHLIDKDLRNIFTFGELGMGEGKLQYPADIAVDADGNFYVADFFNNYWAKFDKNGKWILNVGTEGNGDGQFNGPSGIAVGSDGKVYVSDQLNHRIEVFDKSGNFKSVLSSEVSNPGGMCIDQSNNLYVVDMRSCTVYKLDKSGQTLFKFGGIGAADGQFVYPFDVTLDKDGNIFVVDRGLTQTMHPAVEKFDSSGKFIANIGSGTTTIPQPNGTFLTPAGIAVDLNGNIYVFDAGYFYSPGNPFGYPAGVRLNKFDSKGVFVAKKDYDVTASGRLMNPWSATEDSNGNIWVTTWTNFSDTGEVDVFAKDGHLVKVLNGISYSEPFTAVGGITADGKGNVYIGLSDCIAKFDENFNFIAKIGSGKVSSVLGMAFDKDGNLWCASDGTQSVVEFKSDGTYMDQIVTAQKPTAVAFDKDGNLNVVSSQDSKVYIYTPDGKLISSFGGTGRGEGKSWFPYGIAVDKDGNILISDTEGGRIEAFDGKTHNLLWATPRGFYESGMLSWTYSGDLLVADMFHNVIRIVSLTKPLQADYDFAVRANGESEVNAGETFTFFMTLENKGAKDDSYTVKVDSSKLPEGWSIGDIPVSIDIKANDQVLIPVKVTAPQTATADISGKISLTVSSKSLPSLVKTIDVVVKTPEIPPVNVAFKGNLVPLNSTAVVEISTEKVDNLYGIALTISYDPTLLSVEKVESTLPSDNAVFIEKHSEAGIIVIGYSLKGDVDGISVEGTIVKVTFKGLEEGSTSLVLTDASFFNKSDGSIPTNTTEFGINVYNSTPPALSVNFADNTTVSDPSFTFTGKTDPGCTVTINGSTVLVGSGGNFSGNIYLSEGSNTITVIASSKYNVTNKIVRTVYLKTSTTIVLKIGKSTFTVNGVNNTLDSPPIIKNSRTLVPIRAIVEALGGSVGWDGTTRKVTITLKDTVIELWIGKPQAKVNGTLKWIDDSNHKVMPEIISGRTMVPLRFVSEQLGAKIDWEPNTKTITITYPVP